MRSEFEKWFDQYENNNEYAAKLIAFDGYLLGLKHQQSKVDELQNNINLLNEALDIKEQLNQKLREHEDELQKSVDKAIRLLVEAELYQSEPNIDLAVQALKGEGQ